jgi:taurine dioxygenase
MTYQTMEVRPIAGALGAEIYGADLKDRDDSPLWPELRQAFLEYHVIAVRGQNMGPADLMRVGAKFGEPAHYPFAKGMDDFPLVTRIVKEKDQREAFGNAWHTDTMYLAKPPRATLLYAVETPPKGGDTIFASTASAYDTLSDGMKQLIDGVIGINNAQMKHRRGGGRSAHFARIDGMALQNADRADEYEARHPIVRTHPDTGRKSLYVTALHTLHLDGMTEEESRPLIKYLNDHCIENEFTCRVRWEPGQLTVWDNRCTMHNAVNDYHGYRREMYRLIVGPETPV